MWVVIGGKWVSHPIRNKRAKLVCSRSLLADNVISTVIGLGCAGVPVVTHSLAASEL
jgi:hypothetical protein